MVDGIIWLFKCVVVDDCYDWGGDWYIKYDILEFIIYEMYVCGFICDELSCVEYLGMYFGVIEKIFYLKLFGVIVIEFMLVYEFFIKSIIGEFNLRLNYWGYDFFVFFLFYCGYVYLIELGV